MSFEYSQSKGFKDLMNALAIITEEVTFELDADGLKATAMDPSHVSLFRLSLSREAFDKWYFYDNKRFCLNVEDLVKTHLKNVYKDEKLELTYGGLDTVSIVLRGDTRRLRNIPLLEPSEEELPNPKINFTASAKIMIQVLKRSLKDVDGKVRIKIDGDAISFTWVDGTGKPQVNTFDRYNQNLREIREDVPAIVTMDTDILKPMVTALSLLTEVLRIDLTTDMPMRVDAEIPNGTLEYYLAPCIDYSAIPDEIQAESVEARAEKIAEELGGVTEEPEAEEAIPVQVVPVPIVAAMEQTSDTIVAAEVGSEPTAEEAVVEELITASGKDEPQEEAEPQPVVEAPEPKPIPVKLDTRTIMRALKL